MNKPFDITKTATAPVPKGQALFDLGTRADGVKMSILVPAELMKQINKLPKKKPK